MSKKSKAVASEPVGIVIATGQAVQKAPRVKAYFWFESESSPETSVVSPTED